MRLRSAVEREARENGRWTVLTCDYNGWNDAPEDEREWFDQHPEIWSGTGPVADERPARAAAGRRPRRYGTR